MYVIGRSVGRLIEARVDGLASRVEADRYAADLGNVVAASIERRAPILCADHRPVAVYSQEVSDRLAELFGVMNSRLARVAIVVSATNATLQMQLTRIVREAGFADRKVFVDPREARAFLDEMLEAGERARLATFLGI